MFINFTILINSHQREIVELQVTTPKEALALMTLFESTERVVAWKLDRDPSDFGAAPGSSAIWKKFRVTFTKEDFHY